MIYSGVCLNADSCHIVLLSEAFAEIDQRYFSAKEQEQLPIWLSLIKNSPHEQIQWFFDEHDLNEHKQTADLLKDSMDDDSTFVIKRRKLANIIQFFYEWMAQETMLLSVPDKAWFLASAVRLFDEKERIPCIIDDFPF